jgi:hypothetical protein
MQSKFNIGDKVRFTARTTKYSIAKARHRTRTIRRIIYDKAKCCSYYILSDVGKAETGFYRSYELKLAVKLNIRGRPKLHKRGRPKK